MHPVTASRPSQNNTQIQPICLVRSVSINIYKAGYQRGYEVLDLLFFFAWLRRLSSYHSCAGTAVCMFESEVLSRNITTQYSLPIYGPKAVQFSVGFGPNQPDMHYTSSIIPVDNCEGNAL